MEKSINNRAVNIALVINAIEFSVKTFSVLFAHYLYSKIYSTEYFGLNMRLIAYFSLSILFIDFGFHSALVISNKSVKINNKIMSSVFWVLFIISVFVALILATIIRYYLEDNWSFIVFGLVVPVCMLAYPYYAVSSAKEYISLNFRGVALASSISIFIAVVLSLVYYHITHTKFGLLLSTTLIEPIRSLVMFIYTKWIPKYQLNIEAIKKLASALWISMTTVVNMLTGQIDYIIISILLNNVELAYYSTAFYLSGLLKNAMSSISAKVVLPIYTNLTRIESLKIYHKMIRINSVFVGSSLLVLGVFTKELIEFIYGKDYLKAVIPLRLLVIAAVIQLFVSTNTNMLRAWGFVKREFFTQFFKLALVFIPALIILTYYYGINGAAVAVILNAVVSVGYAKLNLKQKLEYKLSDYPKDIFILLTVIVLLILAGLIMGNWIIIFGIYLVFGFLIWMGKWKE